MTNIRDYGMDLGWGVQYSTEHVLTEAGDKDLYKDLTFQIVVGWIQYLCSTYQRQTRQGVVRVKLQQRVRCYSLECSSALLDIRHRT